MSHCGTSNFTERTIFSTGSIRRRCWCISLMARSRILSHTKRVEMDRRSIHCGRGTVHLRNSQGMTSSKRCAHKTPGVAEAAPSSAAAVAADITDSKGRAEKEETQREEMEHGKMGPKRTSTEI